MLVLRHGHPGGKKKQYYLDLYTPVKPEYDDKEGLIDLDYRVKPDNDSGEWGLSGQAR